MQCLRVDKKDTFQEREGAFAWLSPQTMSRLQSAPGCRFFEAWSFVISGGLSEAGSQRTTSVDLTTSVLVESVQKRIIFHPEPKRRILKHIPKAARSCTGRLLTTIINKILADPSTLHNWQVLLSFAAIVLEQPMRGGRQHNITSHIKRRTEEFFHTWPDKGALLFDQHLQDC